MEILVIVNPRAGSGRANSVAREFCEQLTRSGLSFELTETAQRGEATRFAHAAAAKGVRVIAAVGGDGTFNEVSQILIGPDGKPAEGPDLCLIPGGTGGDLSRTLKLECSIEESVARLVNGYARRVDLGLVECAPYDAFQNGAGPVMPRRAFLNIASVGFSAVIAGKTNRSSKRLGAKMTYLGASLSTALGHRNAPVQISVDGELWHEGPLFLSAFANGCCFGGGMRVAPDADPTDGKLDCVLIGDLNKLQTYALASHIYEGTHLSRRGVRVCQGSEFEVKATVADQRIEIEVDGETPGLLPARIRVLPLAARLRC